MTEVPSFDHAVSERIRSFAMSLPGASEGSSCVNRAFSAGGKNFAFLGERDDGCGLRLKLAASVPDATRLAGAEYSGDASDTPTWVMLRFSADDPPPDADLSRWVTESFRLLAPKRLVAELD